MVILSVGVFVRAFEQRANKARLGLWRGVFVKLFHARFVGFGCVFLHPPQSFRSEQVSVHVAGKLKWRWLVFWSEESVLSLIKRERGVGDGMIQI